MANTMWIKQTLPHQEAASAGRPGKSERVEVMFSGE